MINKKNLNPSQRVDEILTHSNRYGRMAIIDYFITELSTNCKHKDFSDECYWKEVQEEFISRLKYDN